MSTIIRVFIFNAATIKQHEPHFLSQLNVEQQQYYHAKTLKRKTQYIFSRLLLRYALSRCTGQSMGAVDIIEVSSGKPSSLFAKKNHLNFSLSHSGQLYAVAVVGDVEWQNVGIDIEYLKPIKNKTSIRFFCNEKQVSRFYQLENKDEQLPYYYQLWTQKEALLKATQGSIFSDALQSIDFYNVGDAGVNPHEFNVKTVVINSGDYLSEDASLSVCFEKPFEWQICRVFIDEPGLAFREEELSLSSRT